MYNVLIKVYYKVTAFDMRTSIEDTSLLICESKKPLRINPGTGNKAKLLGGICVLGTTFWSTILS